MGEKTRLQYLAEPNFNTFLYGISKVADATIIGDLKFVLPFLRKISLELCLNFATTLPTRSLIASKLPQLCCHKNSC